MREHKHLFVAADPVLVGLNTLQHWLWCRLGAHTVGETLGQIAHA